MPGFNVRGFNSIASVTGGLVSLIIVIIVTLYATIKFFHLTEHYNPIVSSFELTDAKTSDDHYNLAEQ